MKKILTEADILICHNLVRWDLPVYERILGIKIKAKLIDTLALSWYLYPLRNKHGLESHGEDLGIAKPVITDWSNQTQEEYEHRVSEDVKINVALWKKMFRYLLDIYGSDKEVWRLLDYLTLKMQFARLQEVSKVKVDIEYVNKSIAELEVLQSEKKVALIAAMPEVPEISIKTKPKRFINKDGSYSKLGQDWIALLTERGLSISHDGEVPVVKGYEPGNPSSPEQLKSWLYSLGWVPRTFKYVKNKETGELREIPQINLEHGKGICESIKDLYEKEPRLELLDGLSVLQHRIGLLNGFLRDQEDGWIKAQISGFTNTLRVKHTTVVNLPKPEKLYAEPIRGSLIADEGYELCGSDMKSLEDRIKMHYIYPLDPKYVESMSTDDWDPHLEIAKTAGMATQEQVDKYKSGEDKSVKPIRDIAKNCGYACQYGAGVSRLMITGGIDRSSAQRLHESYWSLNWSVKQVAEDQTVKTVNDQMWLYNPVSRFWYTLRYDKDRFSTLVQGTAAYVFDLWIKYILEQREQLSMTFHDEGVWHIRQGHRDEFTTMINKAIDKVNEEVKLNRKLEVDIQYGTRYSQIH
jgi:hypothetical protein